MEPDTIEEIARAIIIGSAGERAANHAQEFDNANWADAKRSAREVLPILDRRIAEARAAGAAEMQERCARVADELGGERVERGPDGDLRRFDMESRHGRGDAVLNAMRVRAQTIATAIRSLT